MPRQSPRFGVSSISINGIVQASNSRTSWPGRLSGGQRQQAVGTLRQAQFLGRTQHALRLDAAQLGGFDLEARRATPRRSMRSARTGRRRHWGRRRRFAAVRRRPRPRSLPASDPRRDAESSPPPARPPLSRKAAQRAGSTLSTSRPAMVNCATSSAVEIAGSTHSRNHRSLTFMRVSSPKLAQESADRSRRTSADR
jgi:hypothetical protein